MKIVVVDQYVLFREGIIKLLTGQPDHEIVGDGTICAEMVEQALLHEPGIVLMGANLFEAGGREIAHNSLSLATQSEYTFPAFLKTPSAKSAQSSKICTACRSHWQWTYNGLKINNNNDLCC